MPKYNVQWCQDGDYNWELGVDAKDKYEAEELVEEMHPDMDEILEVEEQ